MGEPLRIVVMGVSASGKSTVAQALADQLGCRHIEGDTLHPRANVAKMAAGDPLADADRWPWLARIRRELSRGGVGGRGVVVSCSALRRSYRDLLRDAGGVRFVFLDLSVAEATRRATDRVGHFMDASMVASQFSTLERPDGLEVDVTVVDAAAPVDWIVGRAMEASLAPFGDAPLAALPTEPACTPEQARLPPPS